MKTISEQLRKTRISDNISQKEFGRKLNVPQSHVSAIETGKVDPRLTTIIEMARVLGLELMLVPYSLVPTVRSLLLGNSHKPLWSIDDEEEDNINDDNNEEEIK